MKTLILAKTLLKTLYSVLLRNNHDDIFYYTTYFSSMWSNETHLVQNPSAPSYRIYPYALVYDLRPLFNILQHAHIYTVFYT